MPALAPRRRAIRLLVGIVLGCLTIAAPASASYLHLSEGRSAAQVWAQTRPGTSDIDNVRIGSCWHAVRHVVRCKFAAGSLLDVDTANPWYRYTLVLALRGRDIYGHAVTPPGEKRDPAQRVGHV